MLGTLYINPGSKKDHSDHVNTALAVMRKQEKFSDLQFVCKDDSCSTSARIISAHQSIFAKCSVLLKTLFSIARAKQPYDNVAISLDSVSASIMEKLIEYVYEGKTTINHIQHLELRNLCKLLELEVPLRSTDMPNDDQICTYNRLMNGTFAEVDHNITHNTSIQTINSIANTTLPTEIFQTNGPANGIYLNSTPISQTQNGNQISIDRNSLLNNWKNSYSNLIREIKQEPQITEEFSISTSQIQFKKPKSSVPIKESTNVEKINQEDIVSDQFKCPLCQKIFANEKEYASHNSDAHLPNIAPLNNQAPGLSGIRKTAEQVESYTNNDNSSNDDNGSISNKKSLATDHDSKKNGKKSFQPLDGCARTRIYLAKRKLSEESQLTESKRQNLKDAFAVGDLVWGKVKGYSTWPGRIVNPPENIRSIKTNNILKVPSEKQNVHCVRFFVTNNYAWIKDDKLQHYNGSINTVSRVSTKNAKCGTKLQKAIRIADDLILGQIVQRTGCLQTTTPTS